MFNFNPKKTFSLLKTLFEAVIAFHLVALAFETLHEALNLHEPVKVWAWSFGLWFSSGYLLVMLCLWRQSIYQDRIEECAKAKNKLEIQVLKNRQSSKKGKK
jgi:hypothetical protein